MPPKLSAYQDAPLPPRPTSASVRVSTTQPSPAVPLARSATTRVADQGDMRRSSDSSQPAAPHSYEYDDLVMGVGNMHTGAAPSLVSKPSLRAGGSDYGAPPPAPPRANPGMRAPQQQQQQQHYDPTYEQPPVVPPRAGSRNPYEHEPTDYEVPVSYGVGYAAARPREAEYVQPVPPSGQDGYEVPLAHGKPVYSHSSTSKPPAGQSIRNQPLPPPPTRTEPQYETLPQYPSQPQAQGQTMSKAQPPPVQERQPHYPGKDVCPVCGVVPREAAVKALGRVFHEHHFVCTTCSKPLGDCAVYEHESYPYCEADYLKQFCDQCAYCRQPITDKCVSALGQKWHHDHFFCMRCGKKFDSGGYLEKNGQAYCHEDYFTLFAPRCVRCQQPMLDDVITAMGQSWHAKCFTCTDCSQPFPNGDFFEIERLPYCSSHYNTRRNLACAACNQAIVGRCINALGKKWHPEHFMCTHCLCALTAAAFKSHDGKGYCVPCHVRLFT